MSFKEKIIAALQGWIDQVAEALIAAITRLFTTRTVVLIEGEGGELVVRSADISAGDLSYGELHVEDGKLVGGWVAKAQAALRGGRVELVLRSERFLFRPLELPSRAAEFLDGVVRAQIDRLTPWSADQAAFGYTTPADAGGGRIVVTVAATAKSLVAPYLKAFAALNVRSMTISTRAAEAAPNTPALKILEENVARILDVKQARRILVATLAGVCLIAAVAAAAGSIITGNLQSRQDQVARQIAARRAAAVAARNAAVDPATAAERALAQRKNETPSSVIVLEALSQILPDHTYATEMRIEGDKLRLSGITRDAPSLIRLIEQSSHFTRAFFFAPTTRAPSDSGDRFNIEARIEPVFSIGP